MSDTIIDRFYTAFQNKDWKTMQACYDDNARFSDPAFVNLRGNEVKAMWHMLIQSSQDLRIQYKDVNINDNAGSCTWIADYNFSRTGRQVHNVIRARFKLKDGKIVEHQDSFDLWRWTRMALGWPGWLMGWSPFLQNRVRSMALRNLRKFIQNHPEYLKNPLSKC